MAIELTVFNVILLVMSAISGAGAFCVGVYVMNRVPAEWICDYDEKPTEEMLTKTRFKGKLLYTAGTVLSGILFAGIFVFWGLSVYTVLYMLITFVMIMTVLSDGKYCIIPDQFVVILAVLSLCAAYYDYFGRQYIIKQWWSPLIAGLGAGILIIAVNFLTMLIARKEGMGFGDVKLFAALGFAVGVPDIAMALFISVISAFLIIVFTVIIHTIRKKETENYIPFGPSICIGVYSALILHQPLVYLVGLYLSLLER